MTKLAKATQNPVADMYSLPFQNNTSFALGPSGVALLTINQWVAGVVINNVWTFSDAK